MSASFHTLPIWKKDSTAAEWLEEVAGLARQYPERFDRVVIVFEERGDSWRTRWHQRNYTANQDVLGTLECAKLEVYEYMKGRRT